MRISRVQIENFRNFKSLDVNLGQNIVLVGENKSGKSNFIEALRLVLDPSLSENDRRLVESDFWDGDGDSPFDGRQIRVSIFFTDFADLETPELLPLGWLADSIIETTPKKVAQLTYLFFNDGENESPIPDDYNCKIYPGNNVEKQFDRGMLKNIPLQVIEALRDISSDAKVWHRSPLKKLLDLSDVSEDELKPFADRIKTISNEVLQIAPIKTLEEDINTRTSSMVGMLYKVDAKLGLNATTPKAILEAMRLFADGEKYRSLDRISLGMQNVLYLTLLSLLLEKKQIKINKKKESFLPIMALEEPEAHLHPHLQRLVFKDFLALAEARKQPVIITTHSPHLASSASLNDLVLLRQSDKGSIATSAYDFTSTLDPRERNDLERFLDITKSEMLFSKGVIFVEGDVEVLLITEFANILGRPLDTFGISVCNVNGTEFRHVVTLAHQFHIPFAVLTDGDKFNPISRTQRAKDILGVIRLSIMERLLKLYNQGDQGKVLRYLRMIGIFVNEWTLEPTLIEAGLADELKETFAELGEELGEKVKAGAHHIDAFLQEPNDDKMEKVLGAISDTRWGKGRFAHRLVRHIVEKSDALDSQEKRNAIIPQYIKSAIIYLTNKVSNIQGQIM